MAKDEADEKVTESAEAEPEGSLSDMASEIDAAVDAATKRLREGDPEEADAPAAEDAEDEAPEAPAAREDGRDASGRFAEAAPKDETIERAVKAGFSLAEAKKFTTDALLAATCDRIEGVQKPAGSKPGGDKGDGEAAPADPLDGIPDLDPTVYDDQLVKTVAAMKGIVREQAKTIAELRGDRSKGFVATKLEGLKDLTKGDASKESAVRVKFDVLKAGYKAAGQDVTEESIFAEASQLVLGAEAAADKRSRQAAAAEKRSGQRITRPSGRNVEAKPDAAAEIAAMLDKKFAAK